MDIKSVVPFSRAAPELGTKAAGQPQANVAPKARVIERNVEQTDVQEALNAATKELRVHLTRSSAPVPFDMSQ